MIKFVLSNFTLTFLVLGVVAAAVSLWVRPVDSRPAVVRRFLAGYLFFAIGICFAYNFVMHVFFPDMAAEFIGWKNSPFQAEVGYASLGFAAVAFQAFRGARETQLAAILGPAIFQWGAAVGHVLQIVHEHNYAPGNAGIMLWTDILMPVFGFALWYFAYPRAKT